MADTIDHSGESGNLTSVTEEATGDNTAAAIDFLAPIATTPGDLGFGFKADGTPKKRPGRPRKDAGPVSPAADKAAKKNAEEKAAALKAECDAVASMFVTMVTSIAAKGIGPEWNPEEAEQAMLVSAGSRYMQSKGITDVSPGVMLTIVCLAYAAPRMKHENTRLKLAEIFGGVRGFLAKAYRFVLRK